MCEISGKLHRECQRPLPVRRHARSFVFFLFFLLVGNIISPHGPSLSSFFQAYWAEHG